MTHAGLSRAVLAVIAVGLAVVEAGVSPDAGLAVAGPVLLTVTADDGFGLRSQLAWIFGAAVLGGALGWGISMLAAPQVTTIGLGFGIAVGGGFGAVVRLLAIGEPSAQQSDTVTVSSTSDETDVPDPQPVDLFEENPDPVLYFDDSGDGPVVRAANPAFEETFGVESDAVENAALADALMVTDRTEDIVEAARQATSFDAVVSCETAGEERPFRVRTAALTRGSATRGYVLYTAVDG